MNEIVNMGERYSVWSLLKHAMGGHKGWERAWRDPEPKKTYDVVIIGGGGHGLGSQLELEGVRPRGRGCLQGFFGGQELLGLKEDSRDRAQGFRSAARWGQGAGRRDRAQRTVLDDGAKDE